MLALSTLLIDVDPVDTNLKTTKESLVKVVGLVVVLVVAVVVNFGKQSTRLPSTTVNKTSQGVLIKV